VADAFRIGNRPRPEPLVHARIAAQ
jgi:hypothetical protein